MRRRLTSIFSTLTLCVSTPTLAADTLPEAAVLLTASESGGNDMLSAQADSLPRYRWFAEFNGSASSSAQSPFWLTNNRFGMASTDRRNGYVRAGIFRYDLHEKHLGWSFGVDVAAAYHFTSTFILQQIYADLRYRSLHLTIGSREYSDGSAVSDSWLGSIRPSGSAQLSSGDMLFSDNSRPIPQIRLSMPDYQPIPFTKNMLSVKGYISFGIFNDDNWQYRFTHGGENWSYIKHSLFHSKGIFFCWGNTDRHPILIEGGLEMAAQFSGTYYRDGVKPIRIPHSLKDMWHVIVPSHGAGNVGPDELFYGEAANIWGNHVGEWSAAVSWQPRSIDAAAKVYYKHYFEDQSMMFFDYLWKDMLVGVEVALPRNPVASRLVYEFLDTRDQSGPVFWNHTTEINEQISGRDDYYNHHLYSGWQHWGMGIGNPLIISPIYNNTGTIDFRHNRIRGHHFGLEGNPTSWLDYRLLISYTQSWGSYAYPARRVLSNCNTLLEVTLRPQRLPGWAARVSLGADFGHLLGRSNGMMITISKTGKL